MRLYPDADYHSDNGIDRLVNGIFSGFVGHACEVGAFDGVKGSNGLWFEQQGWTVLCVEANPHLAESGRSRRKLWREVACSSEDSEACDFSLYGEDRMSPGNTSLGRGTRYPNPRPVEEVIQVPTRRLDRILEEAGFPKLDFLTVDVEGWEKEVMAGFTVERWRPRVIVLEAWDDSFNIAIPGYDVIERRQYDNLYLRRDA